MNENLFAPFERRAIGHIKAKLLISDEPCPVCERSYTEDEVREMLVEMGSRTLKLNREKGYAMSSRRTELADRILAEHQDKKES